MAIQECLGKVVRGLKLQPDVFACKRRGHGERTLVPPLLAAHPGGFPAVESAPPAAIAGAPSRAPLQRAIPKSARRPFRPMPLATRHRDSTAAPARRATAAAFCCTVGVATRNASPPSAAAAPGSTLTSTGFRNRRASPRADNTVSSPRHSGTTTATRARAPRPLEPAAARARPLQPFRQRHHGQCPVILAAVIVDETPARRRLPIPRADVMIGRLFAARPGGANCTHGNPESG